MDEDRSKRLTRKRQESLAQIASAGRLPYLQAIARAHHLAPANSEAEDVLARLLHKTSVEAISESGLEEKSSWTETNWLIDILQLEFDHARIR